ncbi:ATP-binding protein [Mucilaginibacter sp.]|uniref:ATP-binding protein n=1 Tax=Mucilaginibacter sp. TaxID=1882438 RepID=UPI002840A7D8|nr:ATP-binding protein [Mucilaginibacter sp.]MDR3694890.1 ATP-binding protein [Mucilaginibacter sp.]
MKRLLFVAFLFCFAAAFGQVPNKSDLELNNLPADVTGQWKFHAGDNPAWADTGLNDHSWQHLDPTQFMHFLPQVRRAAIGWFRLTLNVAPALRGKAVSLIVNQYGAAEIYFNGVLIRTMGTVGSGNQKEDDRRSIDEPLTLQLSNAPKQHIIIRYSFNRSNPVIGYGFPVIRATFMQMDSGWNTLFQEVNFYTTRAWVSGCFMLLAILQLAIYFFDRSRKVNLYLSLYAFMQLFTLCDGLFKPILQGTNAYTIMLTVFNIAAPLDFIFLMLMTYAFFGYPKSRWFKALAALGLPVIVIQFMGDNAANQQVLAIYNMMFYLLIIAVSVKAIRDKKDGAVLFLTGIIIAAIFFLLFSTNGFIGFQSDLLISFEVAFAFLPPSIILSILLAREFAQNLVSLRQKLDEVETLSARSLQQEMEKQQILSLQNEVLEQQVALRTKELNRSLHELKSAQAQLIQSEKMASLGELTAGIAHEIQNPLNFVNNFSEVNTELIDEMQIEIEKGDLEEIKAIALDIQENEKKINMHGKRADGIVRGMLEHSRSSSGQKEPTDLNVMGDEYLRLSYHGLRAKDKSFNAEMITHFDPSIPKVNVSQQDMGRVLLNLFNNAFYAVNQKSKTAGTGYKPEVSVNTYAENGQIIIKVKDNGIGIPEQVKDKIMQPFFTTKPTGEGTGLGLSLSYDIIVKGHGGSISVNSVEGEGTEFIITIPIV